MHIPLGLPPPDRRPHDFLAVGANSLDLIAVVHPFPVPDGKQPMRRYLESPGGEAATAAVAVARLGYRARYIGRFGADLFGQAGLAALADAGVDTDAVVTVPGARSQFAIILVEEAGGRRSVISHREPAIVLEPGDTPPAAAANARIVFVDGHAPAAALGVANAARAAGTPVLLDLDHAGEAAEALVAAADVVFVPAGVAEAITGRAGLGEALEALQRASGAPIVGATLGPEGSLTRARGQELRTPAFRVPVTDTTGAGDAFRAGFAAGWLALGRDAGLADVLRWAAAVAALSCRALGAQAALPVAAEVAALLGGPGSV
ncbi:MAG: carbohydrate kinase family protein [Vicinamibacterales bacterium]